MSQNVTPRQRRALEALLAGGSVIDAATAAGVTRKTVHVWLRQSDFQTALAEGQRALLEHVTRRLLRLAEQATLTLESALGDAEASASARVRAADIVLSRLLQLRELVDLEARIAALEKAVLGEVENESER